MSEAIRFYYFSEGGACGNDSTAKHHQEYCDSMLAQGYTLVTMTPLGNLDTFRDSYEGTLVYHWRKKHETVRGGKAEMNA